MATIDGKGGVDRPGRASSLNKLPESAVRETARRAAPTPASPGIRRSPRADAVSTPTRAGTSALDREPDEVPSDSHASREVTGRQSRTAATATGSSAVESLFDRLSDEDRATDRAAEGGATERTGSTPLLAAWSGDPDAVEVDPTTQVGDDDPVDHLVDDPIETEQHTDLPAPPGFEPGSATPTFPTFENQQPTATRELPLGGTEETFLQNGVTYTRTTRPDGSINTSYSKRGVDYSSTSYEDGGSSVSLTASGENGSYSRSVETDSQGHTTDTLYATDAATDPETGEITQQSRREQIGPDGRRTASESVVRPDGGRATTDRIENIDGTFSESYAYTDEEGTVIDRTTTGTVNGPSETKLERSYISDQPIENLIDAPPVPEHAQNVVPLPEDGRQPTRVHDVTVTTDAGVPYVPQVEYAETTYSQTSSDVQLQGAEEFSEHQRGDTFPHTIKPNPDGTSVTHSVSTVSSRDPVTGELTTSTGASQTLTLAGERHEGFSDSPSPEVAVTRVDSWNSAGESATSYSSRGLTRDELTEQALARADRPLDFPNYFEVTVGGRPVVGGPPITDKDVQSHLEMKGGGEAEDWLGAGGGGPLDVDVTVKRDADGNEVQETITYGTVDEDGNGRTLTRSESGGTVGWVYTDLSNDGQDLRRQTVFEGSKLSVYEEHIQTGPETFTSMSQTTDDGAVIASSSASREEVTPDQLRDLVESGELTEDQLSRMMKDGPPYYLSRAVENSEALLEDNGSLRRGEDGKPLQPGHHVSSYEVENGDGYSVSEHYRMDNGDIPNEYTDSRLSAVTDPRGNPPYHADIENRRDGKVTDSGCVEVDVLGAITYDDGSGEKLPGLGHYDLDGTDIATVVAGENFNPLTAISPAVRGAQLLPAAPGGRLRLSGDDASLERVGWASDALGVAMGATSLWGGFRQGNARQVLEGAGAMAGGVESVAAATAAFASKKGFTQLSHYAGRVSDLTEAGRLGTRLGKGLGAVGGFMQMGFGVYDLFTAESGHDQVAAGLNVAAGAVAVGGAFFGPAGWVVGGLLSGGLSVLAFLVAGGDANVTVGIDDRLK